MAEGVFKHLAEQAGQGAELHVESAGLGGWHVGEAPDGRAQKTAHQHGLTLTSTAQKFTAKDFARFDWVLALDTEIEDGLRRLAPTAAEAQKIRFLREFDPQANGDLDVPDPYYSSDHAFEEAYAMIERSCVELLKTVKREMGNV
jgi:protein-tyrosine phosphatase